MAWKNSQSMLGQLFIQHNKAIEAFDDINNLVNCSEVEARLSHIYSKKIGNKAYPPLMIFKALLLQIWHKLSDEQLERSLARNLAYRRFVIWILPIRFRIIQRSSGAFEKSSKMARGKSS